MAVEPELKGKINRYGSFSDGARFAVAPYMQYRKTSDLEVFDRCATSTRTPENRYDACLSLPLDGEHGARAWPLAMERPFLKAVRFDKK